MERNIEIINKKFSKIRKSEKYLQNTLSKYFTLYTFEKGDVLTTPTSGAQDIFLIVTG